VDWAGMPAKPTKPWSNMGLACYNLPFFKNPLNWARLHAQWDDAKVCSPEIWMNPKVFGGSAKKRYSVDFCKTQLSHSDLLFYGEIGSFRWLAGVFTIDQSVRCTNHVLVVN
jgi:hypothetical protein